ncbi:LptM family lipoprotein [Halococcus sediminicola]|uniref:LptM family lipoprotein n=1 Tax=Halococcus sediminicola TaxID=1264579 RepID=UPI000678F929|nr:hypothetical protein [Halococcus sediminicola]
MNRRILQAVLLCIVVVLAGCTSFGGLGGPGEDSEAAASTPGDGTSGDVSDDSSAAADTGDDASSGDGADGASDSSGDDAAGGANGASSSAALDAEEEWFNLSKPGRYVFDIESAEEGTGRMAFETTEIADGRAKVSVEYELGDESFDSTVTGPVGEVESQLVTSPAYAYLLAIQLGGIGAGAVGGEDLSVGDEFSQQSAEGSLRIAVVGTDNYAGVECYTVETRVNGTLSQEVCTQQAFTSAPYVAIYDENGDLSERVELVEYRRG